MLEQMVHHLSSELEGWFERGLENVAVIYHLMPPSIFLDAIRSENDSRQYW